MKDRFAVIGAAALLMISGCVYTGTAEKVDKEEEKEIENDFKEFEEMFADSMGEVDWAVELFGSYEEGKGKKLKISKTGGENEYNNAKDNEATQINDVDNFIESIKIDNWNKVDMLPEELETEYVYMVEQEATDTLLQDNSGIYTEICRITTYKDSEYVTVDALTDYMLKGNLTDVIPESWFISVYKVPEETADYLRN
ncbi:MAG: hypothetical protein KH033_02540 [Clostridiales bacterium]|nr:hypothetical protein [Clostridiales bacterium]